jgi:hypothetical protein
MRLVRLEIIMITRKLLSCVLLLGLAFPTFSQVPSAQIPSSAQPSLEALAASSNKADGVELPADQTVKFDEGFVTLQATCKGQVKWLVISATKIKYFTLPTSNTIIVSIPPSGGLITVFAVGLVDGKITDFVRTSITVTAVPAAPGPAGPVFGPAAAAAAMHVTFVVDLNNATPALAQILNSQKIKEAITTRNAFYRLYDTQSPVLKEKGLDKFVAQGGGAPMVIVQKNDGNVIDRRKIPATEADVLQYLNQVLGSGK